MLRDESGPYGLVDTKIVCLGGEFPVEWRRVSGRTRVSVLLGLIMT
jgi:hypothetical protein